MRVAVQIAAPVPVPPRPQHMDDPNGCDEEGNATHWITKEEHRVKIVDMPDAHLLNTIRMMERGAPASYEVALQTIGMALATFSSESMASYYAEQELDRMLKCGHEDVLDANPVYLGLTKEATRRGLAWEP